MAFFGDSLDQIKDLLRELERPLEPDANSSEEYFNNDEFPNVAEYPGIPDSALFSPTRAERSVFIITISILFVLSMCGNILTLFVNVRRKIRPFFRACLISLAFSDLTNTFFLSLTYMSQFTGEYVQVWRFGATMCSLVPFATTTAIIVSSLTLVGIAVDRYCAVRRAVSGLWNPGCGSCLLYMLVVWVLSICVSTPVFFVYNLFYVYIVSVEDYAPPSLSAVTTTASETTTTTGWGAVVLDANLSYVVVDDAQLVAMCLSNKNYVGLYYVIVFAIIFMPCIVAFVWLNSIIAKTIWLRRRPPKSCQQQQPQTASTVNAMNSSAGSSQANFPSGGCNERNRSKPATRIGPHVRTEREARHVRMFFILILMMTVFLLCRLPAWILLLLRVYNTLMGATDWILYFTFGALNLLSCVLNPIFYTFLAATIEYVKLVKGHFSSRVSSWRICCLESFRQWLQRRHVQVATAPSTCYDNCADHTAAASVPVEQPATGVTKCFGFCGDACGLLPVKLRCTAPQNVQPACPAPATRSPKRVSERSLERDEGVEFSDECEDETNADYNDHQEIYTIYRPPSRSCSPKIQ